MVTVCVPTIGRRDTLKLTLQSARSQTYPNYEVYVLDNASPSEARQQIADYAQGDPRVTVMRSETQLPMFANFQRGVDAATGKYVTFFHDDDVYAPDFLSEHVRLLEANPAVAFAGTNCELIDERGEVGGNRDLIARTETWPGWSYIQRLFALGSNVFPMQSIMFRRSCLSDRAFVSVEGVHYSDFVILMRLVEDHDVGLIARHLLRMRVHPLQVSRQLGIEESLSLRSSVFLAYCDELDARWPARREQIGRLRRLVARARRRAATWAWINAEGAGEARSALATLNGGRFERWLEGGLGFLDAVGASRLLRARPVRQTLRRTAQLAVRSVPSGRDR